MPGHKTHQKHHSQKRGIEAGMTPCPPMPHAIQVRGPLGAKICLYCRRRRGIGHATAVLFAREGARVVHHHCNRTTDADETVLLIREKAAKAFALWGDISHPDVVTRAATEVLPPFGRINMLMNNTTA